MTEEEQKKAEIIKKKAEEENNKKPKKQEMYRVQMEVMAPVELTYKVWAYSPEEAIERVRNSNLSGHPKPNLSRMRKIKATVYKWLYSNVLHQKRY